MSKYKFLVPRYFSMGELFYYLRKRVDDLNSSEALFMFIGKRLGVIEGMTLLVAYFSYMAYSFGLF